MTSCRLQQLQAGHDKLLTSADVRVVWRNIAKDLWVWESSTFQYFLLYLRSIRKRQVLKCTIFVVALNCNQRASSASLHRSSTPFADRFYIADSAQTEYCTTFHFPCVRPSVSGVTSHISHIYKGINAMLIIRGPIKPCIF